MPNKLTLSILLLCLACMLAPAQETHPADSGTAPGLKPIKSQLVNPTPLPTANEYDDLPTVYGLDFPLNAPEETAAQKAKRVLFYLVTAILLLCMTGNCGRLIIDVRKWKYSRIRRYTRNIVNASFGLIFIILFGLLMDITSAITLAPLFVFVFFTMFITYNYAVNVEEKHHLLL